MGRPTRASDDHGTDRGDNKTSLCKVYVFVFVLFAVQIFTIYVGYVSYVELDSKYEKRYRSLQRLVHSHEDEAEVRLKRDTINIQDNSVLRSPADDGKVSTVEEETLKNGSTPLTVDEIVNLKPNFSDKAWIWLNDYSRVPRQQMLELCKVINQNCPVQKGDPGTKGDAGEKGDKGDVGRDGIKGMAGMDGPKGPQGPPGIKGDRGEKGDRGRDGLNGRSGIPGEPGLDGVPGRHGKDGIPGKNGLRGIDGIPGAAGQPGVNGLKGDKGDRGTAGPQGPTGLPGKQGKPGSLGADGIPGTPGITARNCSVNGTQKLLIPPSIVGAEPNYYQKNIVVKEFTPVKIKCSATGEPKPTVRWKRTEHTYDVPIKLKSWDGFYMDNDVLTFMNASRKHMGDYLCIANNGIPPSANFTTSLHVHFPPYIEIDNVILNVTLGGYARLRCKIEAYPHGVYYWEDSRGNIYEETFDRFHVDYYHVGLYETILELNITNIRRDELGIYYCIGKNDEGITKGYINVTDEPGTELHVTEICHRNRIKFGNPGPPDDGKICPDCPRCKVCGFGYRDLEIRTIGNFTSRLADKVSNCEVETIGKPVYHNSQPGVYGSWMRESYLDPHEEYFVTLENCSKCLYLYDNKNVFTNKTYSRIFELKEPFMGNDHVIYNGSFYYSTERNKNVFIIRYDLYKEIAPGDGLLLDYCDVGSKNYLYKSERNYVDVMSDDNGLWVVCAERNSNNTAVTKINTTLPDDIRIEKAWNISVKHQDAGDMFIVCGILYAVDSVTEYDTKISLALDLYTEKLLDDVKIAFTNPFVNTTMISYNYLFKELFTWDSGNMLTYPIKCRALGNETNTNNDTFNDIRPTNASREMKPK